jgi:hypothetical protein
VSVEKESRLEFQLVWNAESRSKVFAVLAEIVCEKEQAVVQRVTTCIRMLAALWFGEHVKHIQKEWIFLISGADSLKKIVSADVLDELNVLIVSLIVRVEHCCFGTWWSL